MITIGLIEDNMQQCDDIEVVIRDNWLEDDQIEFKRYDLSGNSREKLYKELLDDITEKRIHTLIVDYKLDTNKEIIKGWDIVDFLHSELPEFPVIVLTNAPDDSRESIYIDADKVYAKKTFLNPQLQSTKEQVENLTLNMQRYIKRREKLEKELDAKLNELFLSSEDIDLLAEIARIESQLDGYTQTQISQLDIKADFREIQETLRLIEKYSDEGI
ncbi:MAG: hypothetical protein J6O70_04195 [Lachnospiraceae bacterium]|nr:hypothetical protein [Lachnospiraceae bacterium]